MEHMPDLSNLTDAQLAALDMAQVQRGQLARELAVLQEQFDQLAGARAADSAQHAKKVDEYRAERDRLNALANDLTRELWECRNRLDVMSRGCAIYVRFYVDTFAHFAESALTFDTQANLILARQLLAQSIEIPM